jgi:hypothetical protein
MDENEEQELHHAAHSQAVIVSGADDDDDDDDDITIMKDDNDDVFDDEEDYSCSKRNLDEDNAPYYNEHMDEEDEAWVYSHLRSGIDFRDHSGNKKQNTSVVATSISNQRHSDAVLSCPSCFTIVCMDCQQHVKYKNQYRAMFVMNIEVHWESTYVYDEDLMKLSTLPPAVTRANNVPHYPPVTQVEEEVTNLTNVICSEDLYYSVHCNQCKAQVAALCMFDEVYYFFNCIAST